MTHDPTERPLTERDRAIIAALVAHGGIAATAGEVTITHDPGHIFYAGPDPRAPSVAVDIWHFDTVKADRGDVEVTTHLVPGAPPEELALAVRAVLAGVQAVHATLHPEAP